MDFFMMHIPAEETARAVLQMNRLTARYGLMLSPAEARALAETSTDALRSTGRIEFGPSVLPRLIEAFCDSPYLSSVSWVQTIHELIDAFYELKTRTELPDTELLCVMRRFFDGACRGSAELLCDLPAETFLEPPPENYYGLPEPEDYYEE